MVDFAGYRMPIQYKGITSEHLAVRKSVGLFDLSHMGEFDVSGPDALAFLQKVTTNNVAGLETGQIQYSCMTTETGGIVDDLLVYKMPTRYMLVVNAANLHSDFQWLQSHLRGEVRLTDHSTQTALLAIQGPRAEGVMSRLTSYDVSKMKNYTFALADVAGTELLFSRTGYTGEDGFEIYLAPEHSDRLWREVIKAGELFDMELIGLGARDSLRLEMKMALYGNDIDRTTTPIEAGLSWIVDFDKEFIGKDILLQQKKDKPARRLVCLELEGKAFPRKGYEIKSEGEIVGRLTSGTFSPSLQKPIGLGYVTRENARVGTRLDVVIRGKSFPAAVVKSPFYKQGSRR